MENAVITLNRDSQTDIKMGDLLVFLDGEQIANLTYGHSLTQPVKPGIHTLFVSNRLFHKSLALRISRGEDLHFVIANEMTCVGLASLDTVGAGPTSPRVSLAR